LDARQAKRGIRGKKGRILRTSEKGATSKFDSIPGELLPRGRKSRQQFLSWKGLRRARRTLRGNKREKESKMANWKAAFFQEVHCE